MAGRPAGRYIHMSLYIIDYTYTYTDPFWHLKDLEHGPPSEGGNVILDEIFK